jgi:hypothetical protein
MTLSGGPGPAHFSDIAVHNRHRKLATSWLLTIHPEVGKHYGKMSVAIWQRDYPTDRRLGHYPSFDAMATLLISVVRFAPAIGSFQFSRCAADPGLISGAI